MRITMNMNGSEGIFTVMISSFFGAMASVGQLLASAKIITTRRIVASMLGGVTGGVSSGAIFGMLFPDFSQNLLLVSGVGSIGGVAGVNAVMMYFFAKHAPEILRKEQTETDSTTLRRLLDTGEHSLDEIEALIQQKRIEREQRKQQRKANA